MINKKTKWISIPRLIVTNSVADLATAITMHGLSCFDEYGRQVEAPKEDPTGKNRSIEYVLKRLRVLYEEQINPEINSPFGDDRDDGDPLYFFGWFEDKLPNGLSLKQKQPEIVELVPPLTPNSKSEFTPKTPAALADLFKCYRVEKWKWLSKNCNKTPWLKKALATSSRGSRPSTYYPNIVGDGLLEQGLISQDAYNKILFKEAPNHLKDYYQ